MSTPRCVLPDCWWVGYNVAPQRTPPDYSLPLHLECWSLDSQAAGPFAAFDTNAVSTSGEATPAVRGGVGGGCLFGDYGTGNAVWIVVRDSAGRTGRSNVLS